MMAVENNKNECCPNDGPRKMFVIRINTSFFEDDSYDL